MKWYTYLSRFLALCCALAFAGSTIFLVTTFIIERQFLQAAIYKEVMIQENGYAQLPAVISEIVAPTGQIAGLNQNSLQVVLAALLSRQWLQGYTEQFIDQTIAYLLANGQPPSLIIPLSEPKRTLNSPAGSEAVLQAIRQQPACSEAQLSGFDCINWLATDNFCRPPEAQLLSCTDMLNITLFGLTFVIPDQLDLAPLIGLSSDPATFPANQLRPYLTWLQQVNRFGWLLPLFLFLFMSLFGIRSIVDLSLWWAIPLAFVGFGLLGLAIALKSSPDLFFDFQPLLSQTAAFSPSLAQLVREIIQNLLGRFILQMTSAGLIFGVMGAVWLAIGLVALTFSKPTDS